VAGLDRNGWPDDIVIAGRLASEYALVRSKVGNLAPLAADKEIDLGFTADQLHWVSGDATSLSLLVSNLVDNAIRYTPEGGQVDVSVKKCDGKVLLIVADNGPGIPDEERERVFERFYRPAGQDASGSGIGLAIVSQVVQLHSANLQLTMPASGAGAIFNVTFNVSPNRNSPAVI